MVEVNHSWILWLLPLCLLPYFFNRTRELAYSSLLLLPRDRVSSALGQALRLAPPLLIVLLLIALSAPFRPAHQIERIGEGAQIVLLLDRSRSMDEPFGGQAFSNPLVTEGHEAKGTVARRLLSEFVASRGNDMFGMLVFSTYPIQVLPLSDKQEVIQAAITAGNVGRGLSETDVGLGLLRATEFFEDRPYTGSRIVMLISDGGARLDLRTRQMIENLFKRHRVALYWIYIRSRYSPGISDEVDGSQQTAPARALHEFFSTMDAPYRVYDTEDPQSLERAIEDVNRLQHLPIIYQDLVPRRDLSGVCYGLALVLLLALVAAKSLEVTKWQ